MKFNRFILMLLLSMIVAMTCCTDIIKIGEDQTTIVTTVTTVSSTTIPSTIAIPNMTPVSNISNKTLGSQTCRGNETESCYLFSERKYCIMHYSCSNEDCYQCKWYGEWCDTGEKCIKDISPKTTSTTIPTTTTLEEGVECYKNSDCGKITNFYYCVYEIDMDQQQPHTKGTAVHKVTKVPLCEYPGTQNSRCIISHREVLWQSCSGWGECIQHNATYANCTPCGVMGKYWDAELHKCVDIMDD